MSHTPGPWIRGARQTHGTAVTDGHVTIAWCGCNGSYGRVYSHSIKTNEALANARLIAASPDLLEFTKDIAAYLDALPNLPDNDELAQFADRAEALIKAAG